MLWNDQQKDALRTVNKWFREYKTNRKNTKQYFYLAGFAGVGKTTLAQHFASNVNEVVYGAYTGKAADVMRKNGCLGARTIHSLIYSADQDKVTGEITWHLNKITSPLLTTDLVIIDECSMVDDVIGNHLLSYGKPILVLGDPAQLPPVAGAGFFTSKEPDFMLTEIHRQAKDNPIIHLATMIRNGDMPEYGTYGESKIVSKIATTDLLNADQVICGRNITRDDLNRKIRKLLKYDPSQPQSGDRLVCLKNDRDLGIFNGQLFRVDKMLASKYKGSNYFHMSLNTDDEDRLPVMIKVHKSFFIDEIMKPDWKTLKGSQEADYAYVLTCHKSQGSQWNNTLIYDESYCFKEQWKEWLYTAVTRSQSFITMVR